MACVSATLTGIGVDFTGSLDWTIDRVHDRTILLLPQAETEKKRPPIYM